LKYQPPLDPFFEVALEDAYTLEFLTPSKPISSPDSQPQKVESASDPNISIEPLVDEFIVKLTQVSFLLY